MRLTLLANVDIYAYTSRSSRDSDFKAWKEGTIFAPSNTYYGHTSTDNNGNFTISKLVWKEAKPDFGKDADFTTIYCYISRSLTHNQNVHNLELKIAEIIRAIWIILSCSDVIMSEDFLDAMTDRKL